MKNCKALITLFFLNFSLWTFSFCSQEKNSLIDIMLQPIECNHFGIKNFFKNTYNHPYYKDFFPTCFMHVLDLLSHAHANCNEIAFVEQIFLVFNQKLKECTWINPYALIYFIERSQPYLFDIYAAEKNTCEQEASKILVKALKEDFELAQSSPELFVQKYIHTVQNHLYYSICEQQEMKQSFALFIEQSIDRIIFDITEGKDSWDCFIHLASCVHNLYQGSLIYNEAAFQRILWSLCNRFCYCLELIYLQIPNEIYEYILKDFSDFEKMPALLTNEIEALMISKNEWMKELIIELYTKKRAREKLPHSRA